MEVGVSVEFEVNNLVLNLINGGVCLYYQPAHLLVIFIMIIIIVIMMIQIMIIMLIKVT